MSGRGAWIVVIAVGVLVALVTLAGQPAGGGGEFEAGRQYGYAFGTGLIAAAIAYLVLRVLRRRPRTDA